MVTPAEDVDTDHAEEQTQTHQNSEDLQVAEIRQRREGLRHIANQ